MGWTGDSEEDYDWEIWKFDGVTETWSVHESGDDFVDRDGALRPVLNGDEYDEFEEGIWGFRVRADHCGDWEEDAFVVLDTDYFSLENTENQCPGCACTCPLNKQNPLNGDAQAALTTVAVAAGGLAGFVTPMILSAANPHPVTYARIQMPIQPEHLGVAEDAEGSDETTLTQNAIGEIDPEESVQVPFQMRRVGPVGETYGATEFDFKADVGFRFVKISGGGEYDLAEVAKGEGHNTPVQDLRESAFGRRASIAGVNFLKEDDLGGPRMYRGIGTSVQFVGGNSPDGSFLHYDDSGSGYSVWNDAGEGYGFDSQGRMISSSSPVRGTYTLAWDIDGDPETLDRVTMGTEEVTYSYSGDNIDTVTYKATANADGLVWSYTFGEGNLLTKVTGPANSETGVQAIVDLTYETVGDFEDMLKTVQFTTSSGAAESIATYSYDQYGNVTGISQTGDATAEARNQTFGASESKMLDGDVVWIGDDVTARHDITDDYSTNGLSTTRVLDQFGKTLEESEQYESGPGQTSTRNVTYERNEHGQVTKMTNSLGDTFYNYDGLRRLTSIMHPDGSFEEWRFDDSHGYSGPNNPWSYRNQVGHVTVYAGGGTSSLGTTYQLDKDKMYRDQVIHFLDMDEVEAGDSVTVGNRFEEFTFQLSSGSTETAAATALAAAINGAAFTENLITATASGSSVTISGELFRPAVSMQTEDDDGVRLSQSTGSEPYGWNFFQNLNLMYTSGTTSSNGLLTSQTLPNFNGNGSGGTISYSYDSGRRLIHTYTPVDGKTAIVTNGYDDNGHLSWTTEAYEGPADTDKAALITRGVAITDYTTDNQGNVLSMSLPDPDGAGPQVRSVYTYTYDAYGRLLTATEPGANGGTTTNRYNVYGGLKEIEEANPGSGLSANTSKFEYDDFGYVTEVTIQGSSGVHTKVEFDYSESGLLLSESLPYPNDSNASDSHKTKYTYDEFGRILSISVPDGPLSAPTASTTSISYDYDTKTVTTVDPLSRTWVSKHDAIGRTTLTESPDPAGATPSIITTIEYRDGDTSTVPGFTGTAVVATMSNAPDRPLVTLVNGAGTEIASMIDADPDGSGPLERLISFTQYDGIGRVKSQGQTSGGQTRQSTYTYDINGQIESVATPATSQHAALVTSYEYDNNQRLESVTTPGGAVTTYEYNVRGLVEEQSRDDLDGNAANDPVTTYTYDVLGRVKTETSKTADGGTITTTYDYDQRGNLAKITTPGPNGNAVTEYRYGDKVGEYNSAGAGATGQDNIGLYLTGITTPGGDEDGGVVQASTTFRYDAAGRMVEQYRPNADAQDGDGKPHDLATEKWEYDAVGQLKKYEELYRWSTYHAINYDYDELGRLKSVGDGTRSDTYTYNVAGDLSRVVDAAGRIVEYGFDNIGRITDTQRYLANGTINDTTTNTYDHFGRVATITQQATATLGGTLQGLQTMTTSYVYDDMDRTIAVTDPLGNTQEWFYNDQGLLGKYETAWTQPPVYEYDAVGRMTATSNSWTTGAGVSNSQNRVDYTYNAIDQVETTTDNLNRVTTNHYTDLGQLEKTVGPAVGGQAVVTEYDYDNAGNLISLKDPSGNETEFFYDARNRQRFSKIVVDGSALWTSQAWTDNDMIYQSKDRNNVWTELDHEFRYGAPGNYVVTQEEYTGGGHNHTIDYTYGQGNGLWLTAINSSGTGGADRIEFDYDDLGRVTKMTDYIDGTGTQKFDVTYNYDEIDRRQETEFLINGSYDSSNWYYWDNASRLQVVKQFTPTSGGHKYDYDNFRAVRLNYRPSGEIASIDRWNGINGQDASGNTIATHMQTTEYGLDSGGWIVGRIGSMTHEGIEGGDIEYSWDYNDLGLITEFVTPDATKVYGYDDTNQLTSVTTTPTGGTASTQTFNYDGNGNNTAYTTGDHNRLEDDGTYTYEYDNQGNRTKRILKSAPPGTAYDEYQWNHRNQLIRVTTYEDSAVTQKVEYDYDALNRRIRRRFDNDGNGSWDEKQRFLYDTNVLDPSFHEVVLVLDELNSDQVTHRFMNGPFPDQVFSVQNAAGEVYFYLHDNQNTVTDIIQFEDSNGDGTKDRAVSVNHIQYDAHGNITDQTDDSHQPLQTYTGQILDDATGLLYYDARWFDPGVNQFINDDPMGFAAGDTNLRRYVGNSNPNFTDPTGNEGVPAGLQQKAERLIANGVDPALIVFADRKGRIIGGMGWWNRNIGWGWDLAFGKTTKLDSSAESAERRGYCVVRPNRPVPFKFAMRAGDTPTAANPEKSQLEAAKEFEQLTNELAWYVGSELALEFGVGPALKVTAAGGKLFFRHGKKAVSYTAEQLAKKLGRRVDDLELDEIAKRLNGQSVGTIGLAGRAIAGEVSHLIQQSYLKRAKEFFGLPADLTIKYGHSANHFDKATHRIYLTCKEGDNFSRGVFYEELQHAIDWFTGTEKFLEYPPPNTIADVRLHEGTFRRMFENPLFDVMRSEYDTILDGLARKEKRLRTLLGLD